MVGSKTKIVTDLLLNKVKDQYPEYEVELIDLKGFQLDFCDGRPPTNYNDDTKRIISKFEQADGYILGTTIMHGNIPGALKNLFDLLPVPSLEGKAIAFAATGGNPDHAKAIEHHLKPLTNYLNMKTVSAYVFATSNDFNTQNDLNNSDIEARLKVVANEFGKLLK